jgi:hypothetical protein
VFFPGTFDVTHQTWKASLRSFDTRLHAFGDPVQFFVLRPAGSINPVTKASKHIIHHDVDDNGNNNHGAEW